MKRASTDTQALVYAYRCAHPIRAQRDDTGRHMLDDEAFAACLAEQQRARALWDRLVDIDTEAARTETDIARANVPAIAAVIDRIIALKAQLAPLFEARAIDRKKARKKITTQHDAAIDELSAQRREARAELWAALKQWRAEHRETVGALETARRQFVVEARQTSGLYWGTYNQVLDDYARSRARGFKTGWRPRKSDPAREDGCLTVQIQRTRSGLGAAPGELFDGSVSALQLAPVPAAAHDPDTPRGERGRLCRTRMQMRIDAAGTLVTLPLVLHRPLPPVARVKKAQLTWRRVGTRIEWQLALTVTQPAQHVAHAYPEAYCGIDVGWRKLIDGAVRVAWIAGSDGASRSIEQAAEWHAGMDHAEALQGRIDDLDLDRLRSREALEMVGLRSRLLGQRRETYRLLARDIAMRYARVAIDDSDLGELARRDRTAANGMRVRAAASEFIGELGKQCAKHGAELLRVEGPSTVRCHACGAHTEPQDRTDMLWTCHACGVIWDQDENAARNLLLFAAAGASAVVASEDGDSEINGLREREKAGKRSPRNRQREPALLVGAK